MAMMATMFASRALPHARSADLIIFDVRACAQGTGCVAVGSRVAILERFQEEWNPVFRPKTRQTKKSSSIGRKNMTVAPIEWPA
jgi:hypothetical protein